MPRLTISLVNMAFTFKNMGAKSDNLLNVFEGNALGLYIDEWGGIYSHDGKILLKAPDTSRYQVKEGTEHIAKDALMGCRHLNQICFPYTFHYEDLYTAEFEMFMDEDGWVAPCIGLIIMCNKPYAEETFPYGDWWEDLPIL